MKIRSLAALASFFCAAAVHAGDPCNADLDGSGTVDGLDLGTLLANWSIPVGSPGCAGALPCPSDINGDTVVDGLDLGILLSNWLTTGCDLLGPIDTELAGSNLELYPFFDYVNVFNLGSTVNIALDPTRFRSIVGRTCDVYIVADKTQAQWTANTKLTDVTIGGFTTVNFVGGTIQLNRFTIDAGSLAGPTGTNLSAAYDVVCDCDQNGQLSGPDFIDGRTSGAGLYIARDTTAPGPFAVSEVLDSATAGSVTPGFESRDIYYPSTIASMGQIPLMIVSHGNGHNYQWYDHIGNHLASYGYIVVSHRNNTIPGVLTASTTTLEHTNAIIAQQGTAAGGALSGHIDSRRIMWIGHSRGGEGVVISVDRILDGAFAPVGWNLNSLRLVSSMAPTDFEGPGMTTPHGVNYHLWTASADADVSGCAWNPVAEPYHLHDRAEQYRQSICIYGAGHGDLHDGGGSSVAAGPCLIGRPTTHQIMRGYFLPLAAHYLQNDPSGKEFLWRQYESFRAIGAPDPAADPCIAVNLMYRDGDAAGSFMIDNFQSNFAPAISSSGGAVTMTVSNYLEGLADDANASFEWTPDDPMNGMTLAGAGDTSRVCVFDWDSPASIEWQVVPGQRDLTGRRYLQFRACQGTQHPNTTAVLGDLHFKVELRDSAGTSSSIDLMAFAGGVEEPYQRAGCGFFAGPGWNNEFETIRVRITDFLNNGSGLDLTDVVAVRLVFGETAGSTVGRIGIDEIELTSN